MRCGLVAETDLLLTAENVERVFSECLHPVSSRLVSANPLPQHVVVDDVAMTLIEGIVHKAYLKDDVLQEHRHEVAAWIRQLSPQFHADGGGGWSFLNLCNDAKGELWTGLHLTMEHLCMLAIGLNLASFMFPREMWDAFPGSVPYVVFTVTDD
jgi:hypothetical protein